MMLICIGVRILDFSWWWLDWFWNLLILWSLVVWMELFVYGCFVLLLYCWSWLRIGVRFGLVWCFWWCVFVVFLDWFSNICWFLGVVVCCVVYRFWFCILIWLYCDWWYWGILWLDVCWIDVCVFWLGCVFGWWVIVGFRVDSWRWWYVVWFRIWVWFCFVY